VEEGERDMMEGGNHILLPFNQENAANLLKQARNEYGAIAIGAVEARVQTERKRTRGAKPLLKGSAWMPIQLRS